MRVQQRLIETKLVTIFKNANRWALVGAIVLFLNLASATESKWLAKMMDSVQTKAKAHMTSILGDATIGDLILIKLSSYSGKARDSGEISFLVESRQESRLI